MITNVAALKFRTDTNASVNLNYITPEMAYSQLAQASSIEQLEAAIAIFNRELERQNGQ
jgi:hypothetical protein